VQWQQIDGNPRRAGVSSFGIGGTNAHVILEEAPTAELSGSSRPWQLLVISAKTPTALETASLNLAKHFEQHPEINFADVAYTLCKGRKAFDHRRCLVSQNIDEAAQALHTCNPTQVFSSFQEQKTRTIVFMFSGQGTQYVNMGLELYQTEAIFREQVDLCSEHLKSHLEIDLPQVLYPKIFPNPPSSKTFPSELSEATQQLKQTAIAQTALFA